MGIGEKEDKEVGLLSEGVLTETGGVDSRGGLRQDGSDDRLIIAGV